MPIGFGVALSFKGFLSLSFSAAVCPFQSLPIADLPVSFSELLDTLSVASSRLTLFVVVDPVVLFSDVVLPAEEDEDDDEDDVLSSDDFAPGCGRTISLGRDPGLSASRASSILSLSCSTFFTPLIFSTSLPSLNKIVVGNDATPLSEQRSLNAMQFIVANWKS